MRFCCGRGEVQVKKRTVEVNFFTVLMRSGVEVRFSITDVDTEVFFGY